MPFIVESGSKQYIVEYGQKFIVDRVKVEEGEIIDLPVIFSYNDETKAASVKAKVVKHQKGTKIRVVKFKSKSNYHKQSGFRAFQTILELVK